MKKRFLVWVSFLFPMITSAAVPSWKISLEDSKITFIATQNDAPVEGRFARFDGDIQFDPEQLKDSRATIKVKTDSVFTALKDIADTLEDPNWLSANAFPEAIFKSTSFDKKDSQRYQAHGDLTIRDKTFPVVVDFSITNYSPEKASIKGTMKFQRTLWGLGQGEWANTKYIKDDVSVDFVFNLKLNK